MEHLVRYTTNAGETRYEQAASLDAAVELVERLRNEDEVRDAQVFRQVPIEVKAYYKVVVPEAEQAQVTPLRPPAGDDAPPPGAMPLSPPRPTVQVHDEPPAESSAESEVLDEEGSRRSSLFGRGG